MRHIFCQEGTFSIQKALFSNNWALFLAKKNNTWAKGHFFTKTDMIEGGHKVGNYQGQDGHCPPSMYVSLTPGRPDFWALVTRRGGVHYSPLPTSNSKTSYGRALKLYWQWQIYGAKNVFDSVFFIVFEIRQSENFSVKIREVLRDFDFSVIGNFCFDWNFLLKSTANESYDKYSNEFKRS